MCPHPARSNYFIQVVYYILPETDKDIDTKIYTFKNGQDPKVRYSLFEAFQDDQEDKPDNYGEAENLSSMFDHCSLKLMSLKNGTLHEEREIVIEQKEKHQKLNIEFSPDGRFLAILGRESHMLMIYEINENDYDDLDPEKDKAYEQMNDLFDNINQGKENQRNAYVDYDQDQAQLDFNMIKRLEFDSNSQFLIVFGSKHMSVLDLREPNIQQPIEVFDVDQRYFSKIIDCQMVSSEFNYEREEGDNRRPSIEFPYRIDVACRQKNEKCIVFFGIEEDQKTVKTERSLNFFSDNEDALDVKISEDFKHAVLVNRTENYILHEENEEWHQNSLNWLHGKVIRIIYSYGSDFIFVACKEYDRDIDVMSSRDAFNSFKISIPRKVEPGVIKFFDIWQRNPQGRPEDGLVGFGDKMQILSIRDEEFYFDEVNPYPYAKQCIEENDSEADTKSQITLPKPKSYMFSKYRAFSKLWPYVAFQGLEPHVNYLWIINAYKPKIINRILLPSENLQITQSFITPNHDLFVVCEEVDRYNLYSINLDYYLNEFSKKDQRFHYIHQFDYLKETVHDDTMHNLPLLDFYVRSSSERAMKKKMAFFLHQGQLWCWNELDDHIKLVTQTQSSMIQEIEDSTILVRNDNIEKDMFQLTQIQIGFSDYEEEVFYQEKNVFDKVKTARYDIKGKILLMLKVVKNKGIKYMKIYDTENEKILWNGRLNSDKPKILELIGRMKSGLYMLCDSHLYFNNCVIKIRMDLINQKNIKDLVDEEVFDFYTNIIDLEPGEKVKTKMPQQMLTFHRQLYITSNQQKLKPNKIMFLPFFHERNIYFSRMDEFSQYFYTAIQKEQENLLEFITMNITKSKLYRYRKNGTLIKRYNYSEITDFYGLPVSVSNNGQIFLFKKKKQKILSIFVMNFLNDQNINGLTFIKDIDIESNIVTYLKNTNIPRLTELLGDKGTYQEMLFGQKSELKFAINDNMDVIVIMSSDKKKEQEMKAGLFTSKKKDKGILNLQQQFAQMVIQERGSIVYIQRARVNIRNTDEINQLLEGLNSDANQEHSNKTDYEHLFITTEHKSQFEHGMHGFSINRENVFFWNDHKIWYLKIEYNHQEELDYWNSIKLQVNTYEKQTQIKKVRTGSNPYIVAIVIKQSMTSECVITWDIKNDDEIESFDMDLNLKVFWDSKGEAYFTEQNYVNFALQGVKLTCFNVGKFNNEDLGDLKRVKFGYHNGHRCDSKNNSWLFLRDFISLPFSYMTFVIKSQIHGENSHYIQDDYLFDVEQYNYLYEGKTCFTDDDNTATDHEQLQYILKKFEETDPTLLEQIQYYHIVETDGEKQIITPLHIALDYKNNRSIKILLEYMAKIETNNSNTFRDIIPMLVDYTGFSDYLENLPLQTIQMRNKQTLRVDQSDSSDIVRIAGFYSSYVDMLFFQDEKYFGEDIEDMTYKSFPVKVEALRVQWILYNDPDVDGNEEYGQQFLQAIYNSKNIDLYDITTIEILIEFLFREYKKAILTWDFPIYMVRLIFFFLMVYLDEGKYEMITLRQTVDNKDADYYALHLKPNYSHSLTYLVVFINLLLTIFGYYMISVKAKQIKWIYLLDFWGINDITLSILQIFICYYIMTHNNEPSNKSIELNCGKKINDNVVITECLKSDKIIQSSDIDVFTSETCQQFCVQLANCLQYAFNSVTKQCMLLSADNCAFNQTVSANNSLGQFVYSKNPDIKALGDDICALKDPLNNIREGHKRQRQLEAIVAILIWTKSLYYMQLIDSIAPLVFIIFNIFKDIAYFVFTLILALSMFANAFYLIGKNQAQFDETLNPDNRPIYYTISGSLKYCYLIVLGELSIDDNNFGKGNQTQLEFILWPLFIIATFVLIIHLLNMLIALMGQTFASNSEIADQSRKREHLKFILENSWMDASYLPYKNENINYLVTAFINEEDEEDVEIIKDIQEDVQKMRVGTNSELENALAEIKKIKNKINNLARQN